MEFSWLDPERLDRRDIAGALAVIEAARAVDTPLQLATISTNYSYLLRNGWSDVSNVEGGITAWQRAGLPVERG